MRVQNGDVAACLAAACVLVVEDEILVAMEIEALLNDHGYRVLGPAHSVDKALELLAGERPHAALLDVNLAGQWVTPVAQALAEVRVPFILVTGYGRLALADPLLQAAPSVPKPMNHGRLVALLAQLLDEARRGR
jgi:DNA-binding NtrC family response regulator